MDKNGFANRSFNQSRPRWNLNSSNSWTKTRHLSTAKSNQSGFPGFHVNGRPKCLSDPITRRSKNGVDAVSFQSKPVSLGRNNTFHPAAGVTTIDQSWRQNRTPWNGSTFLSRKADINNNTNMHKAGSVLSRKTTKLEALNGRFETLISSGSQDLESASVSLGSMGLSQQSSYTDADKLNEKQTSRKKVVLLTDHSLKRMRETSNIYLQKNSAFHKQRLKKIETNIGSKHRAAIDRQLTEVEHIQKEKYKKSIQNMKELTNVRDRFWKEKKKRVKNTYVSVAALEMPEVDRYAYGLPADGKEYTFVKKRTMQSKSNTAEKWNESMQKARSIVKVLGLREKVERTMTLPILKPLTLHSKSKTNLNKEEVMEEEDINDNTEKTELRNLEGEDESKIDNFAENSADAGLNAINALLDLTSEISSLHETTTDLDTDFEDL